LPIATVQQEILVSVKMEESFVLSSPLLIGAEMIRASQSARDSFLYFWRGVHWGRNRIVPGLGMTAVKAPAGSCATIGRMLECGADTKTSAGRTALDIAEAMRWQSATTLLREHAGG